MKSYNILLIYFTLCCIEFYKITNYHARFRGSVASWRSSGIWSICKIIIKKSYCIKKKKNKKIMIKLLITPNFLYELNLEEKTTWMYFLACDRL